MRLAKINNRGLSIIELLLATVLVAGSVIVVSLMFPKSMKVNFDNQQRADATNLAASKMSEVKSKPYALLSIEPPLTPTGAHFVAPVTSCDCNVINFSALPTKTGALSDPYPFNDDITVNAITYRQRVCINRTTSVGAAWLSTCYSALDVGSDYINIRVWVGWVVNGETKFVLNESVVTRFQ